MATITVSAEPATTGACDVLVVGAVAASGSRGPSLAVDHDLRALRSLTGSLRQLGFSGAVDEVVKVPAPMPAGAGTFTTSSTAPLNPS